MNRSFLDCVTVLVQASRINLLCQEMDNKQIINGPPPALGRFVPHIWSSNTQIFYFQSLCGLKYCHRYKNMSFISDSPHGIGLKSITTCEQSITLHGVAFRNTV